VNAAHSNGLLPLVREYINVGAGRRQYCVAIFLALPLPNPDHHPLDASRLYTTTEPCVLCFGAIVMSGIRRVRYASTDALAGGAYLKHSNLSRNIKMQGEHGMLGII
jgi:hypothetical protein